MHKIIVDLYITLVLPLSVITALLLWHSIRMYRLKDKETGAQSLLFAVFPLTLFFVFFLISDNHKVILGLNFYGIMEVVSPIAFLLAGLLAFDVVNEHPKYGPYFIPYKALKVMACVLALLLAAASTVYFRHQTANAKHVLCPQCDDTHTDK